MFRKLISLFKNHRLQAVKFVGITTAHSLAFLYIPYLFRAANNFTDDIGISNRAMEEKKEGESLKKEEKKDKKGKNETNPLLNLSTKFKDPMHIALDYFTTKDSSVLKKYAVFFGTGAGYLFLLGLLSRIRIVNTRVLEDLLAQDLRRKIVKCIYLRKDKRMPSPIVAQKAINDVNLITHSSAVSLFTMMRGAVFASGGLYMLLTCFPQFAMAAIPFITVLSVSNFYFSEKIRMASKRQIESQDMVSKEIAQMNDQSRSIHLSNSFEFFSNFLTRKLDENHKRVKELAIRRGKNFMFFETMGIGYLLTIVSYGSYLISTGQLANENILLTIFAIYAAIGVRSLNNGYAELKEKVGVINSVENFFQIELTSEKEPRTSNESIFNFYTSLEVFFEKQLSQNPEASFDTPEVLDIAKKVQAFLADQKTSVGVEVFDVILRHSLKAEELSVNSSGKLELSDSAISDKKTIAYIDHMLVEPGECRGIAGISGIGKSTLFDFLCDFGPKLSESKLKFHSKRDFRTFYFTQVPEIFMGSFCLNVAASNLELLEFLRTLDAPEDAKQKFFFAHIRKIFELTNLWNKIKKDGNHGEMQTNSPGEKQRLMFARMFFSNADLILLDESVSNLDPTNIEFIDPTLKEFLKGRTSLIITHNEAFMKAYCKDNVTHLKLLNLRGD